MQNTEIRRLQIWKQWKEFRKEIGTIKPLKIILLYTRSFWLLQIFNSIKINNRDVSFYSCSIPNLSYKNDYLRNSKGKLLRQMYLHTAYRSKRCNSCNAKVLSTDLMWFLEENINQHRFILSHCTKNFLNKDFSSK